jgi:hypothetical protein
VGSKPQYILRLVAPASCSSSGLVTSWTRPLSRSSDTTFCPAAAAGAARQQSTLHLVERWSTFFCSLHEAWAAMWQLIGSDRRAINNYSMNGHYRMCRSLAPLPGPRLLLW